ncbi:MAG: S-methyl-5-thioribose-1-phosphate isomerase [Candidatus Bathyarchaeia archaeon]|nr:S-methyl-5-thioribose-1-phosphate isomerase [Candidatus Bathyarchaeota archaeon]
MRTVKWEDGVVITIDQALLPNKEEWIKLKSCDEVAKAIKEMRVRGAPLIGVLAAYGLALTAYHSTAKSREVFLREIEQSANLLRGTRPTAANLFWAIERILNKVKSSAGGVETLRHIVIEEAQRMADEDVEVNKKIGEFGSELLDDGDTVLTHCNAGRLATVDYGTALSVIRVACERGKHIKVIATETRPKLQGARLTVYELMRDGIPVTLITDNMVGYVMYKGMVNKVIVGADRIVRDAVINKIGTYTIAVLAHEHKIPFYVAAPLSTFDLKSSSKDVIIEERSPDEITNIGAERIAPPGVAVFNPAFDITPIEYVSAIICEKGVLNKEKFDRLIEGKWMI